MKSIEQWLCEYSESHQHRVNKTLHWVCVPLIVLSLLGLLWSATVPIEFRNLSFRLNWAIVTVAFALIYYAFLSISLTIGMLLITIIMFYVLHMLSALPISLWLVSMVVFLLAWVGQIIGHQIEGKRPSFFKDLQFLLIGPLWLLSFIYKKLGIPY
jgi:uncharacterized membrane protein YGL010W